MADDFIDELHRIHKLTLHYLYGLGDRFREIYTSDIQNKAIVCEYVTDTLECFDIIEMQLRELLGIDHDEFDKIATEVGAERLQACGVTDCNSSSNEV